MIRVLSECDPNYDKPDLSFLNAVTTSVLNSQKITKAEITFIFASDELLAELKSKYFNEDHFTDVIAFRLNQYSEPIIEGEVYISLPRAKENAKIFEEPYKKEVTRLIVHGCLHLIGFKDKTISEKKIMTDLENNILDQTNWELIFDN